MATDLTRDVSRETHSVYDRKGNKMIVTLKAGDMLEFRPKGRSIRYEVPIASCLNLAMIQFLHDNYSKKVRTWKQKKLLGRRTRKPRRPPRLFSKMYYDALRF